MRPLTKIILAVALVALSALCVALFVMSNNSIILVIYNPVTNTTTQKEVDCGKSLNKYIETPTIQGYTFVDYYTSTDFLETVDINSSITNNATIVLGYCKNITSINDATNNVVGVKFSGQISQEDLNTLLLKNYKYLDLSDAVYSGDFLENNYSLQTLILPAGNISKINNYTSLKNVYAQESTLLTNCFNNCLKLENVDISGVINIQNCFNNCPSLTGLNIPQSLQTMDSSFVNTHLKLIQNNSSNFLLENGVLYYTGDNQFIAKKAISSLTQIELNPKTTKIDSYAFYNHPNIINLTLDAKVSVIDSYAFAGSSIKNLKVLQNNVLTINDRAFSNCINLENISLGQGIKTIGNFAFYNTKLTEVSFEDSVLSNVNNYAFANCNNLQIVKFLDGQVTLGNGCFSGCKNLLTVANLNTLNLPEKVFENCEKLVNLVNFSSVENVGNYAFLNCKNLVNITELATIKTAGIGSFQNCESLVSARFLNLENLSQNLFFNCTNLNEFVSAENIISFNSSAFDSCTNLQNISFVSLNYICENGVVYNIDKTQLLYYLQNKQDASFVIPNTVNSINTKYLSQNVYLQNIICNSPNFYSQDGVLFSADKQTLLCYPSGKTNSSYTVLDGVKTITKYAFVSCPNLTRLTINNCVERLENGFLWQILNLATLNVSFVGESINNITNGFLGWFFGAADYTQNYYYVPQSLKEINVSTQESFADYCFYDCSAVFVINLSNASSITKYMFYGCFALNTISINKPLQKIEEYAFYNCKDLMHLNVVYNENLESQNINLNAFTNTPNGVNVTLANSSKLTPKQVDTFSSYFKDKQYNWVWKTAIIN